MHKPSGTETGKPPAEPPLARRDWRFERCGRLLGKAALHTLAGSHVAVFGLGGVGSYAAEGLARSGIGRLTLVDFDRVCVTNINRQLQALTDTVGAWKAELMAARVRAINPKAEVHAFNDFYNKDTAARLLDPRPDVVIDCIDNVTAKMHLVAGCIEQDIPIVTALGAGAKLDPTRIRIVPLTETHTDPLGRALRKYIRRKHAVTAPQLAKVVAVFSDEPVMLPITDDGGVVCGVNCVCPSGDNAHHTCKKRHVIYGAAVFVTSVFGMVAASAAVRMLVGRDPFSR
ncbi:MAG: tRNA threonylcarbamoyladenosine dehydratase [Kiritimatiellia bacterium]|jgi:tRNA A37 threonylcarbamoyladenosine dehydratase